METVRDFIFLGSKITADGECSHEIKRHVLLGRKAMTKLDSILKSRDITLLIKVYLVRIMVSPGVIYGHERWTIKKAEPWRIYGFELWCWRRLESPVDCKEIKPVNPEGNLSWILIGSTDAEAETLILWLPDAKCQSIRKDPGKDWRKRRGQQRMRSLDGFTKSMDMSLTKLQETVKYREACHATVHGVVE